MSYVSTQPTPIFKKCSLCSSTWATRDEFLSDPLLEMIGYQVNFKHLELGAFLFNHNRNQCCTTLAIEAGKFKDLYDGPIYSERFTGTQECPQYCVDKCKLNPCPAKCECAYVREIIQIIRNWTKLKH